MSNDPVRDGGDQKAVLCCFAENGCMRSSWLCLETNSACDLFSNPTRECLQAQGVGLGFDLTQLTSLHAGCCCFRLMPEAPAPRARAQRVSHAHGSHGAAVSLGHGTQVPGGKVPRTGGSALELSVPSCSDTKQARFSGFLSRADAAHPSPPPVS